MSILDERDAYLKNPYFEKHEYGDFTPFYVTITICSVIGGFLFILNIAFCWCSRHHSYWKNRHTGNRWIQSLWTVTPHNNPPLDLTELESGLTSSPQIRYEVVQYHTELQPGTLQPQEYTEMQKREKLEVDKMGLHVFWPATVCLTLFVVCVIMILLKYGPRLCKVRHEPLPSEQDWEGKAYSRKLSISMA